MNLLKGKKAKVDERWKKALFHILNREEVYIPEGNLVSDKTHKYCEELLKSYGEYDYPVDNDGNLSPTQKLEIYKKSKTMRDTLKSYGLIISEIFNASSELVPESKELGTPNKHNYHTCRLKVNDKGIETILKLQEHDDNDRRFRQQSRISIGALIISCISIAGLAVNIVLGNERLSLSLNNNEINQKRLEYLENDHKQNNNTTCLVESKQPNLIAKPEIYQQ